MLERLSGGKAYRARYLQNKVVQESKAIGQYQLPAEAGQQLSLNFADRVDIYLISRKGKGTFCGLG